MRILHFISTIDTRAGGPARAVLDLSHAMASRGHVLTVVTTAPAENGIEADRQANRSPLHVASIGTGIGGLWSPRNLARMSGVVRNHDVLHLHGMWDPANVLLALIAHRQRRPYAISIRGMLDDWSMSQRPARKRLYLALLGSRWLHGASAIHLTAQRELEQAGKYIPADRGHVIPNLLDMSLYADISALDSSPEDCANRALKVLFISRIHEKKGIEVLLRAVAHATRYGGRIRVTVAGDGEPPYVRKVQALAQALRIHDSIEFIGHVSGERKVRAYSEADIVVLPTQQENFGFVFFEALLCGRPLVTSPEVDMAKELQGSGGAAIVERDPEKLAGVLRWFQEDPRRLREHGARGRDWVLRELSVDRIADRFEEFYEGILRRSANRRGIMRRSV